uniref:Transposase domain-containing protein n=1 Tax=Anopheles albimanus TaxID=7167 RepID=A0A182FLP4_ANOAL
MNSATNKAFIRSGTSRRRQLKYNKGVKIDQSCVSSDAIPTTFETIYEDLSDEDSSRSDEDAPQELVELFNSENCEECPTTLFLRKWAVEEKVPHATLKPLLRYLATILPTVPRDPRTILRTPRSIPPGKIYNIEGGQYWHHSIERCLSLQLADLRAPRAISLNLNMDGLPIYANGRKQFWPILGKIREEPKWRPFAIGIFYGHSKPKRVEEYLEYLVKELKLILEQGMTINGFRVTVTIRVIICDSPARAFIKGCIGFNAFHGCPKCTTVGNRRGTYRVGECPARSDTMYRSFQYGEHHQRSTVLALCTHFRRIHLKIFCISSKELCDLAISL